MDYNNISQMDYQDTMNYTINCLYDELGEHEMNKIYEKVKTSKKFNRLIGTSLTQNLPPSPMDFMACIHEIPYFLFGNKKKTTMGAMFALKIWVEEVNSCRIMALEDGLKKRALKILEDLYFT